MRTWFDSQHDASHGANRKYDNGEIGAENSEVLFRGGLKLLGSATYRETRRIHTKQVRSILPEH